MSRFTTNGATGPGSDYWLPLPSGNSATPDPLPTTPPFDRAALEARRAACPHPAYIHSAWDTVCRECGALWPGSWLVRECGVGR